MEQAAFDVILPILESSMVLAGHYAKCCNRDVVTAKDLEYALKYVAQNHVGDKIGSFFPEIYEDSSDSGSDTDFVTDDEEPFTVYQGSDEWCNKMNASMDSWNSWIPAGPAEISLKNAIEKKSV